MMGPWKGWYSGALVIAFLLSLSVVYFIGKRTGQTDARLSINAELLKKSDDSIKSVQIRTDSAKKQVAALDTQRGVVRTQIRVVHDSIFVKGENNSDSVTIVSPTIAHLIQADDSLISAQKHALALQDTLISSLRRGSSLRDERIKLLESRGTSRISRGVQIGVGYCQTATSRTPCLYAGYGLQLRLP